MFIINQLHTLFSLKTGFLKWKPDYELAADSYSKAATCYKSAKELHKAKEALYKACDCYKHIRAFFSAAKYNPFIYIYS